MKYPTKHEVKKVGPVVRVLAVFIFLCSCLAAVGLVLAMVIEPFEPLMLLVIVVIGLMVHVSGSVVFSGYAPKYLLFAHAQK